MKILSWTRGRARWLAPLILIYLFVFFHRFTRSSLPAITTAPILETTSEDMFHSPELPPAYVYPDETDEHFCQEAFSTRYITTASTRWQSFCPSDEKSALHCFWAPRMPSGGRPGEWGMGTGSDPLCIAHGVYIPSSNTNEKDQRGGLSLQCQPANISQATPPPSFPHKYDDLREYEYFYWTGVGKQLRKWTETPTVDNLSPQSLCTKDSAFHRDEWILVLGREMNHNIWHQLMVIWQAFLTIDILLASPHPSTPQRRDQIRIVIEDDEQRTDDDLYLPLWVIDENNNSNSSISSLPRLSELSPGCYSNVIMPLAGSSSPYWTLLLRAPLFECYETILLDTFISRFFKGMGIERPDLYEEPPRTPSRSLTITIINRMTTRRLHNLPKIVDQIKLRHPNHNINVVDFAQLSYTEQIELSLKTDILVGHHGAGLVHTLFVKPGGAVVEILPKTGWGYGFRQVVKNRGLTWYGIRGMLRDEYEALDAWELDSENNDHHNEAEGGSGARRNTKKLPEGWTPADAEEVKLSKTWQKWEWVYVDEEKLLELIKAATNSFVPEGPDRRGL